MNVFGECQIFHALRVLSRNHDSHTLLRLADGDFCSVEPGIFQGHSVEIYIESVRKFADRDTDSARAKIVAAFD